MVEGSVTFWRASKLGTAIWGAVIVPKGLTLLIVLIAVWMTLFAAEMSLWILVRRDEATEFTTSLSLILGVNRDKKRGENVSTHLLNGRDQNRKSTPDN